MIGGGALAGELWSFIEIAEGKIHASGPKMASEAKRATKQLAGTPCGLVFGDSPRILAELEDYGLEKIYFYKTPPEPAVGAIADNIYRLALKNRPEAIFFAANGTGSELGARLAAKSGQVLLANLVDYESGPEGISARRSLFKAKACQQVSSKAGAPFLATIYEDSLQTIRTKEKIKPEIIYPEFLESKAKARLLKRWQLPLSEIDLTEASIVIGIGGGIKSKEFLTDEIEKLAELIEAVIGGTRVAVSKGLLTSQRQIGATGKFINADVYLPIGISGSNRHTVGLRNAKRVFPINVNKDAPIFKLADRGAIGDLYEVIPLLTKRLKEIVPGGGPDSEDIGMRKTGS